MPIAQTRTVAAGAALKALAKGASAARVAEHVPAVGVAIVIAASIAWDGRVVRDNAREEKRSDITYKMYRTSHHLTSSP
jgi:hypothetical protein